MLVTDRIMHGGWPLPILMGNGCSLLSAADNQSVEITSDASGNWGCKAWVWIKVISSAVG